MKKSGLYIINYLAHVRVNERAVDALLWKSKQHY